MSEQPPPEQRDTAPTVLRWTTLILTNAGKVLGLVIAYNELLVKPHLREAALGFAGALIWGAQTAENVLLGLFDRVFDQGAKR